MVSADTEFQRKVFLAAQKIPRSRVSTYSLVAQAIGKPKAYRAVGNALNKNRDPNVPCHRVVRSDGTVGGFAWGTQRKAEMLEAEGIKVVNGKLTDLDKALFRF